MGRDLACDIQLQRRKERPFVKRRLWRKSFPLRTARTPADISTTGSIRVVPAALLREAGHVV
jgi:hypothetical protein